MAMVVVIGLLSITLASSYSMLRTQVSCVQIQSNSLRRSKAQLAAMAGIQAALQAVSQPDWAGVGVPVVGNTSDTDSYSVTVETGDPSLHSSHPDYAEFPYRVTLISTGTAYDSNDPNQRSIHRQQVVVQLVRRKLADPPSGWLDVLPYTLYDWSKRDIDYELPVRVEGPCYMQGELRLCNSYPDGAAKSQYLGDLEQMRVAGFPDHRPFDGPLYFPFSRTPSSTRSLLANELNLSINDIPKGNSAPFSHPGNISSYRLYPGGMEYLPQDLPSALSDTTLAPQPEVNPLGIFKRKGTTQLWNNVMVHGLLLAYGSGTKGDILVDGDNISIQAVQLPPLEGDGNTYQLPAIAANGDVYVYNGASGTIQGTVYAGDDYKVWARYTDVQLHLVGKLICGELDLQRKLQWDQLNWYSAYDDFDDQSAIPYFPQWVEQNKGIAPDPVVTVKPDPSGVVHHWHDWSQPIFVPHPDDGGLRWEVIAWKDGT